MGRPLFSQNYISAPAVRTAPEPTVSHYEKWTHWNPFDPDSEEFLENDPVYEAFIEPSSTRDEDQRMVVHMVEGSTSSASSDGSAGERGSPMAVGSDDPVHMLADAYPGSEFVTQPRRRESPDAIMENIHRNDISTWSSLRFDVPESEPRPATVSRTTTGRPLLQLATRSAGGFSSQARGPVPRTSDITPITIPSRTTISHNTPQANYPPSTPLAQSSTFAQLTPSPAPSVTPRILNWAPRPSMTPGSPSGPLTNPSARMSLAHITPTLIRVRDVVI